MTILIITNILGLLLGCFAVYKLLFTSSDGNIEVTFLEAAYTESGTRKLEKYEEEQIAMLTEDYDEKDKELPEGYEERYKDLYEEMGLLGSEDSQTNVKTIKLEFTKDDFYYEELKGVIRKDELTRFFKTLDEDNTTVKTSLGEELKIKESVEYLKEKLAN